MTSWQDYLNFMKKLSRTLEELAQVEREKNDAVSEGNLSRVEECMKREQALSMSLRGLEQKRSRMLADFGVNLFSEEELH